MVAGTFDAVANARLHGEMNHDLRRRCNHRLSLTDRIIEHALDQAEAESAAKIARGAHFSAKS